MRRMSFWSMVKKELFSNEFTLKSYLIQLTALMIPSSGLLYLKLRHDHRISEEKVKRIREKTERYRKINIELDKELEKLEKEGFLVKEIEFD